MATDNGDRQFDQVFAQAQGALEQDGDWSKRLEAVEQLSRATTAASPEQLKHIVDLLSFSLKSEDKWEVKRAVAECLGKCALPEATAVLEKLRNDGNRWVRETVDRALLRLARITRQGDKRKRYQEYAFDRTQKMGPEAYSAAVDVAERWYAELAGDMSHEITTVVANLREYLMELEKVLRKQKWVNAEVELFMNALQRKTEFFHRLVVGLMDYGNRKASFTAVNLKDMLSKAIELARSKARLSTATSKPQCKLDVSQDAVIRGDADKLMIAFSNIIANAMEAVSPEGGLVRVAVTELPPDNIEITVIDDGRGIPVEQIDNVKKRFTSLRKDEGGVGLGLPVAIVIVESIHGGNLEIESGKGQGTKVTIHLPQDQPSSEQE